MSGLLMAAGIGLAWAAPGHPAAWVLFIAGVARWTYKEARDGV